MSKSIKTRFALAHVLLVALLLIIVFVPDERRNVSSPAGLFGVIAVSELLYLVALARGSKKDPVPQGSSDIICAIWLIFTA